MFESTTSKLIAAYVVHKVFCEPSQQARERIKTREQQELAALEKEIEEIDALLEELDKEQELRRIEEKNYLFPLSKKEKTIKENNKSFWQKFIDLFK